MTQARDRSVPADFQLIDDLVWRASRQGHAVDQPIRLCTGSRIGPILELTIARRTRPNMYANVHMVDALGRDIVSAIERRIVTGTKYSSRWGVFPLMRRTTSQDIDDLWDHWRLRLQFAAEMAGFSRQFAKGLAGAVGELVANVDEHSDDSHFGVVVFRALDSGFEVIVSDAGIGVLASLRKAPAFSTLNDAGRALQLALSDGISSTSDPRRGFGYRQLFRTLAGYSGEIRCRSGDHSLTIGGEVLSLQGSVTIAQRAPLAGLTISILCRSNSVAR